MILGLGALAFIAADIFGLKISEKAGLDVVIGLLATLSIIVALERRVLIGSVADRLQSLDVRLRDALIGAEIIKGKEDVYKRAALLLKDVTNTIRTVAPITNLEAPDDYRDQFIKVFKENKNIRNQVILRVDDPLKLSPHEEELFKQGVPKYQKIQDRIPIYLMGPSAMPIEFQIYDDKHVLIGVGRDPKEKTIYEALLFRDQPRIARFFCDWFDNVVKNGARPLPKELQELLEGHQS